MVNQAYQNGRLDIFHTTINLLEYKLIDKGSLASQKAVPY